MSLSLFFLNADSRILEQIKNGDEEALVTLYKTNRKPIGSFMAMNNGSSDDAEDMLQEALVVLWERVRSGKFEYHAQLNTFIFATVKNMWLRQLARKRRVSGSLDEETMPDGEPSVLDLLIEDEQANTIRTALKKLGDPCQALLLMFYWEELSMEEIAPRLGFANAQTAKSKKYQCKKALEKLLRESL